MGIYDRNITKLGEGETFYEGVKPKKKTKTHYNKNGEHYGRKSPDEVVHMPTPARDRIYALYPVGTTVETQQILEDLADPNKGNHPMPREKIFETLNRAVRDGEVSRRKISGAGARGCSTVVLWTFLERRQVEGSAITTPVRPDFRAVVHKLRT